MPGMEAVMTGDELKEVMRQHGWTEQHLADSLELHIRTVGRYRGGALPVPRKIEVALAGLAMLEGKDA